MLKAILYLLVLSFVTACQSGNPDTVEESETAITLSTAQLADSLLYFRHHYRTTDILSRNLPDLSREQAIDIQLAMLEKELDAGAKLVGWKMGGTITNDSTKYDPMFGYILDKNLVEEDSTVLAENFPGGQVMVEGEVGFVMSKDFPNGVESMEDLKDGIEHVVSAIEFAQATAVPSPGDATPLPLDYVFASGMGQAGVLVGSGTMGVEDFDAETETVAAFINDEKVAEGGASRVYLGPLNALHSLANLLPQHGQYLKKGDVVITGSLYDNPTIDSTSQVHLEYANLGTIDFSMQ